MTPYKPRTDSETALDQRLKRSLGSLPPRSVAAALEQRVLAGWQAQLGAMPRRGAVLAWGDLWQQRRWRLGGAGFALGLVLAVGVWLNRPDPVLQELLQPDVLSQIAADQL